MIEKISTEYGDLFEELRHAVILNAPKYITALIILLVGVFFLRIVKAVVQKYIHRKATDTLATDFLVSMSSFIFMVFLIVVVMGVLGWNSITNKILTAAGIGTFVIGFALKDIGENFLAGFIMAFRRPFRIGDLVEVNGITGRVQRMSLRDTSLKTLDGRDVYIPNGMILKNPLQNYTMDNYMRQDFSFELDYQPNIEEALDIITRVICTYDEVVRKEETHSVISQISTSTVKILVRFWFATDNVSAPGLKLKSKIMVDVMGALKDAGFTYTIASTHVVLDEAGEKTSEEPSSEKENTEES